MGLQLVNSLPSTFRITYGSRGACIGFLYHRFSWKRDWREPHASRQNISGRVYVSVYGESAAWALELSVLFGFTRHARPTYRTLHRSAIRIHVDDWDAFPAGFVFDLALEFIVTPTVHHPTITSALPVTVPVEFPYACQLLHDYAETACVSHLARSVLRRGGESASPSLVASGRTCR